MRPVAAEREVSRFVRLRGNVWFEPDVPRVSAALSEAEAVVSRVNVALALADLTDGFADHLLLLSQQLAAVDFDAWETRLGEPSTSVVWARQILHVRTLLLEARLEVAGLGSPGMVAEAQALRARADGLLEVARRDAAGVFETAFVAAEVYVLDGKLQVQAGDREAAIHRLLRAKWLYREAAYRGAVGTVQIELLALLRGGCPECDAADSAPAICPFCTDAYGDSCSPNLCPDCEAPVRVLRRRMWLPRGCPESLPCEAPVPGLHRSDPQPASQNLSPVRARRMRS
jgi:hypothetical protein